MDSSLEERGKIIIKTLTSYPDFPKKGVSYKDISPTLKDPDIFKEIINIFSDSLKEIDFDYLVCLESRGFIYGTALSMVLNKGMVLIRKPGKLPG